MEKNISFSSDSKRIKGRIEFSGDEAIIKYRLTHPMESGHRITDGQALPAHHITNVICKQNGTLLLSAQFGTGISENPPIFFKTHSLKSGDVITIEWLDNQDERDTTTVTVP